MYLLTADSLILSSTDFNKTLVDLFNGAHYNFNAKVVAEDSWQGVIKTLGEYLEIKKLVFLLHSMPGNFLFHRDLSADMFNDSKSFDDATSELGRLSARPIIKTVDLDGCNAGKNIAKVLQLGLAFGAEEITATNYFHEFAVRRFTAAPGEQKNLEGELQNFDGYITSPYTRGYVGLAQAKRVDQTFLLEWHVETASLHGLLLPEDKKNRKGFKTRGSARLETVRSTDDLKALQRVINAPDNFIRYTIKLEAFRRSNIP